MRDYLAFVRTEARWLLFGLLLAFLSSLGQTFFVSLFSAEIRGELGLNHTELSTYYALGTIAGAIALFWLGWWIDWLPLHLYAGFTLAGLAAAGLVMATVPSPMWLLPAFFLLRLFGQGLSFHISATSMARWFARNRGKAIGIAGLGMPIGEALLPPLVVILLAWMSWREVWWLLTMFLVLIPIPLAVALVWHGERQPRSSLETEVVDDPDPFDRRRVMRDRRFWLLMPAVMGPPWIFTGIFFHQVAIVEHKGWEFSDFAAAFAIYALSKVVVGLATGSLVDRFTASRVAPWSMPIMGVALALLVVAEASWLAWPYMLLIGIHVGVHMTAVSALWPELYGRRFIGSIKAMIMAIGVFVSALGPPLFGIVLDRGWGIESLLWVCVAYTIASSVLMSRALR